MYPNTLIQIYKFYIPIFIEGCYDCILISFIPVMDSVAKEAFDYLNKMRMDPTIAIAPLSERLKNFKGNIL